MSNKKEYKINFNVDVPSLLSGGVAAIVAIGLLNPWWLTLALAALFIKRKDVNISKSIEY